MRAARQWLGGHDEQLTSIYDSPRSCLVFEPLYIGLSPDAVAWLEAMVDLPDNALLLQTSTSPFHEASSYAAGMSNIMGIDVLLRMIPCSPVLKFGDSWHALLCTIKEIAEVPLAVKHCSCVVISVQNHLVKALCACYSQVKVFPKPSTR